MINKTFISGLYYKVLCFILYFAAASASFNGYYDKWHFREAGVTGAYKPTDFSAMVDGTAARPYIYRQLLPSLANWLDSATPPSFKARLYTHLITNEKASFYTVFDSQTARSQTYFFRYLVVYIAVFLFTLLAVYAMNWVCSALQFPPAAAIFAPVLLILLFPYILSVGAYFYDYPELAFLALAVWVALKFDWWWLLPVAVLGTWNKESFVLIVPTLYPFLRQRRSRLQTLLAIGVLCAVCTAVHWPIQQHFAQNPGQAREHHLADQIAFFRHPHKLFFKIEKTYGLVLPALGTILPLPFLIWTVWLGWRHLPTTVKRHAQIAAAINIPLYILYCLPGELRDLSLLYMAFLAILAGNLKEWLGSLTRPKALADEPGGRSGPFPV